MNLKKVNKVTDAKESVRRSNVATIKLLKSLCKVGDSKKSVK